MLAGADHVRVTSFVPLVACRLLGADGAVNGMAAAVVLGPLLPARFTANTRNTYAAPLVRPVTVAVRFEAAMLESTANVAPPSTDFSMTYEIRGLPPFDVGADHVKVTWESPPTAVKPPGTLATPNGVASTTDDVVPAPAEMRAVTRKR